MAKEITEHRKSYATFGLERSMRQIHHNWKRRKSAEGDMAKLFEYLCKDKERIEKMLGRELNGLNILEIGPGQGKERAYFFGLKNRVTAVDLDVIPDMGRMGTYWEMYRKNGAGRVIKSLGRYAVIGQHHRKVWANIIEAPNLTEPRLLQGDICSFVPGESEYDVVMSWSVFEHLSDPRNALRNIIHSLKPGGIFYISIHLFTSNNGHHDIRAFTGDPDSLPLWAHLRLKTRNQVQPSAFLNEWRLADWRDLFSSLAPGYYEFLEQYEHPERYGPFLQGELRGELSDYRDEELLTVNSVYCWKKPDYA
jgi:SAM-dependent methyltransferase